MSLPQYTKTAFASAARIATPAPFEMACQGRNSLICVINVTASAATPSVVFTIQGYDRASDTWYTILASAAITGAGQTILRVMRGLTAAANLVANDLLPDKIRITPVHADADSITYSVGLCLVDA